MAEGKRLKAWNLPWLGTLATIDTVVLYFLLYPERLAATSWGQLGAARIALSAGLPILVLLITSVLPQHFKAVLVFWKMKEPLPGHRAFTKYGPADPRIDMGLLSKHVGTFPTSPHDENAMWYRLYRAVATEHNVMDSHKSFLLFRDMAAISILLAVIVPATLLVLKFPHKIMWTALALFSVQYLLSAIAARNSGVRLVTTVLAEHSARRVTKK